ncbi:MAG: hypothetical protein ACYDH6_01875 [Acidimicrobiales bacterium]
MKRKSEPAMLALVDLFEEVDDILRGIVPPELGDIRVSARRYGIKAWFGSEKRQHYEAQVIGASAVDDASILALELGFHLEQTAVKDNEAVLATLLASERRWRATLGPAAVAGPFLGRQTAWRRLSETWPDPNLADAELPFEVAARLTDYITVLEPILRGEQRRGRRKRAGTIDTLA